MPRRGIKSAKREEDRRHSDARRTKEAEVWENVDWETHNDESEEEEEEFVLDARSTEKRELNEDRGDEEVEEYSEEARAAAKAASSGVMLSAAQLERVLQVSLAEPSNKRKRGCSGNSDDSAKRPKKPGLTKVEREQQVWLHRLHLLCWLAHQLQLQEAIRSELLRARLLSLLPSRLLQRLLSGEEELDDGTLLALLRHLEAEFRPRAGGANAAGASSSGDWPERLERALAERCADDVELTVLACALLRALGFRARLVLSYSVLPARASRAAQPPPMPPAFAALELRPPAAPGWTHLRLRPAALRCPLSHADPARLPAPLRPPRPIARRSARPQSDCMSEEKEEEESEERGDARQEVTSEKDSEEEEAPEGGTGGRPAADGKPRARRGGPSPVAYVVGADERGCFRDLTPRYACEYTSRSLPLRPADPAGWWEQALASVQKLARAPAVATGASQPALEDVDEQAEHVAEEQELAALAGDLPRTQAALRQHPLYVLEKQIGAYEIAWPPDCAVGQLPCGQRIFPRANLRRLRTAEGWLKEGMQVRTGEQPIKRVRRRGNEKARRTRELRRLEEEGRLSEAPPELLDPHSQQEVELFGEWQIEPYRPPVASNGMVPRNSHGNVYMFRPDMLPIGCVHLRLPGIAALCRRLGIDFAPALTGFDVRGCFSVPSYDGVVVCQEYAPALRLAWEEQEARLHEKLYYKQRKHIVQLWQRLARSLLMHQHVQQTYVTQSPISTSPQILKKQLSVVNDTVHVHHFEELFLSDQKQWIKYCTCGFQITFERI